MKNICEISEKTYGDLPEKVLQFGEGNFLRAFADYIIETGNKSGLLSTSVLLCQPIETGKCDVINSQSGLYTVYMRGLKNGAVFEDFQKITCVSRCINPYKDYESLLEAARAEELEVIISNTTEAGIAYRQGEKITDMPPFSYPAKLTAILYERYATFNGDTEKGVLILPVELIEDNGKVLKSIVLHLCEEWKLEKGFIHWLNASCYFATTLVDRIVTGFPEDEYKEISEMLGYHDRLLTTCEPFLFWAIECPKKWAERFPIDKLGFSVFFADDISPYRTRKVRILNGAHTLSVLAAYLCGHSTVLEMMHDDVFNHFIKKTLKDEILPTINLPEKELVAFANSVLERFSNPFIKHKLLDISLNSISKYKSRCLPTLLDYIKTFNKLPRALVFSLGALLLFYKGDFDNSGVFYGRRNNDIYEIKDEKSNLDFINKAWHNENATREILGNTDFWGMDLNSIEGLAELTEKYLKDIIQLGMKKALQKHFC